MVPFDAIQIAVLEGAARPTRTPFEPPRAVDTAPAVPRRRYAPPRPAPAADVDGYAPTIRLRSGPPRLAFDAPTLERFERAGVIAPSVAPQVVRPARGPSFSERVAMWERDATARITVVTGHVQPFLYEVVRAARRDFKPAEGRLYADPRSPNTIKRAARAWANEYLVADPRYLAYQRALAEKRAAARGATLDEADLTNQYDRMIEDNDAANAPIASMVCVTLRPDAPPKIEVSRSSGNGELDRAAIESLTHATTARVDPEIKPQRACYHFTAAVERAPPMPLSGCTFDEVKLTASCYYPTMKVLRTNVTLASVE